MLRHRPVQICRDVRAMLFVGRAVLRRAGVGTEARRNSGGQSRAQQIPRLDRIVAVIMLVKSIMLRDQRNDLLIEALVHQVNISTLVQTD